MEAVQSNVLTRDDTFFGVCQALGEDFRFNPLFLRIGFALALFFSPIAAVGGYAAAGLVVGLSRWLVPNPRVAEVPQQVVSEPVSDVPAEADSEELAIAA